MKNAKQALKGLQMYCQSIENITDEEEFDFVYNNVVKAGIDNNSIFNLCKYLEFEVMKLK